LTKLAEDRVRDVFKRFDPKAEAEFLSESNVQVKIAKQYVPSVIGRKGITINELQKDLNVHIDVIERNNNSPLTAELPFSFKESKTAIILSVDREHTGMRADVYVKDSYITSSRIGRKGQIKISKRSEPAKKFTQFASSESDVKIFLK